MLSHAVAYGHVGQRQIGPTGAWNTRRAQEELGFRARLHRNYIGALERGEINPTFRTLRTLAEGLDVELSSLMRLYEERQEDRDAPASRVIGKANEALRVGVAHRSAA